MQRQIELNTNGTVDHNDKEKLNISRKQTTSYTFMGSKVVENARKAHDKKTKNKTKIVIGNKQKVNASLSKLEDSIHNFGDSKKQKVDPSSLVLLKK